MREAFPEVTFIKSVAELRQAPPDNGREIAFAGRSNAGKSSALNTLCGKKRLARTSKTPGRTQLLNFFRTAAGGRLVDLPGYGYARVSAATRAQWDALLARYLEERRSLKGLVLIMDIRHPLKPYDIQMLEWCTKARLPVHVLLTKADKLSHGRASHTLQEVTRKLASLCPGADAQLFSSVTGLGTDAAQKRILEWLEE